MKRYLNSYIEADLEKKMVFLGGPRQVGKTTLSQQILPEDQSYLNWDIAAHRECILKQELPTSPLIIFDEIHKYSKWRNYLKGLYDLTLNSQKILVTGSARLDYYRFGGDSLQGRYHYLRLHPLSVAELNISSKEDFMELLTLGGFPEPFLSSSYIDAKRWSREYRTRLIQEEIASLENVKDLGTIELLALRLPDLVTSPLSINALREDLQVSHKSVSRWVEILERMYAIFRLSPMGSPKVRAVKKEQKHYHTDWTLVPNLSKRFENLVASHLLKWVHFRQDIFGENIELRYFRDSDGREVDFAIIKEGEPSLFIECKWSDAEIVKPLKYLNKKFPDVPAWQIHATGQKDYMNPSGIRVAHANILLKNLI